MQLDVNSGTLMMSYGERIAVIEARINNIDAHVSTVAEKVDQVLEGQRKAGEDRFAMRSEMEKLCGVVEKYGPDVQTVRDAKTVLRWAAWVAGGVAATVSTVWVAWTWVVQHISIK